MRRLLAHWPLAAAIASALMLAAAHAFETFGHMAPCELCLKQRTVYWVALALGLVGYALARTLKRPLVSSLAALVLVPVFLWGAWLAAYHAGVEWHWWPGPRSCTGSDPATTAGISALLKGGAVRRPSCDVAAWRMLGVSMAGYNAVISLALTLLSLRATGSRRRGLDPA